MSTPLPVSTAPGAEISSSVRVSLDPATGTSTEAPAIPSRRQWVRLGSDLSWRGLFEQRTAFEAAFANLLLNAPQRHGRVLDIGCGDGLPGALECLWDKLRVLDGVDPDPAIARHPLLQQRWQAPLEQSDVPEQTYSLAYAYNVVEHLADARPFFKKVYALLQPGGVFFGLAPNANHPFAVLSRMIEVAGLKAFARRSIGLAETGEMRVNDYPAYYRCNSPRAVGRAVRDLGFREVTFYFHPCVQWDNYFPRWLRWAPHSYDYLLGSRLTPLMQVFMVRLQK